MEKRIAMQQVHSDLHTLVSFDSFPTSCLHFSKQIGEGAFATVWLAACSANFVELDDEHDDVDVGKQALVSVAVKKFKSSIMKDPVLAKLVFNEAGIHRDIKHPYIVQMLRCGAADLSSLQNTAESFYLVEEYVKGIHLRKLVYNAMLKAGTLYYRRRDALRWMYQLASALAYLHGRTPKIMHRDLKLENLMLTGSNFQDADIRLCDFGLACILPGIAMQTPDDNTFKAAQRSAQETQWSEALRKRNAAASASAAGMSLLGPQGSKVLGSLVNSVRKGKMFSMHGSASKAGSRDPTVNSDCSLHPVMQVNPRNSTHVQEGMMGVFKDKNGSIAPVPAAPCLHATASDRQPRRCSVNMGEHQTDELVSTRSSPGLPQSKPNVKGMMLLPTSLTSLKKARLSNCTANTSITPCTSPSCQDHASDQHIDLDVLMAEEQDTCHSQLIMHADGHDMDSSSRGTNEGSSCLVHVVLPGNDNSLMTIGSHRHHMSSSAANTLYFSGTTVMTASSPGAVVIPTSPFETSPYKCHADEAAAASSCAVLGLNQQDQGNIVGGHPVTLLREPTLAALPQTTPANLDVPAHIRETKTHVEAFRRLHTVDGNVAATGAKGVQKSAASSPFLNRSETYRTQTFARCSIDNADVVAPTWYFNPTGGSTSQPDSPDSSDSGHAVGRSDLENSILGSQEISRSMTHKVHVAPSTSMSRNESDLAARNSEADGKLQGVASAAVPMALRSAYATGQSESSSVSDVFMLPVPTLDQATQPTVPALPPYKHQQQMSRFATQQPKSHTGRTGLKPPDVALQSMSGENMSTPQAGHKPRSASSISDATEIVSGDSNEVLVEKGKQEQSDAQSASEPLLLPCSHDQATDDDGEEETQKTSHVLIITDDDDADRNAEVTDQPKIQRRSWALTGDVSLSSLARTSLVPVRKLAGKGLRGLARISISGLRSKARAKLVKAAATAQSKELSDKLVKKVSAGSDEVSQKLQEAKKKLQEAHPDYDEERSSGRLTHREDPGSSVVPAHANTTTDTRLQQEKQQQQRHPGGVSLMSSDAHGSVTGRGSMRSPFLSDCDQIYNMSKVHQIIQNSKYGGLQASLSGRSGTGGGGGGLNPRSSKPAEDNFEVYNMTQGAGSLMYMAPEVFKGLPYNEKADVFSFAICLYEVLHLQLLLTGVLGNVQSSSPADLHAAVQEYAAAVAAGYRPPMSEHLPVQLEDLIRRCWSGNPLERPSMGVVMKVLEQFMCDNMRELDEWDRLMSGSCTGCCSIQ